MEIVKRIEQYAGTYLTPNERFLVRRRRTEHDGGYEAMKQDENITSFEDFPIRLRSGRIF